MDAYISRSHIIKDVKAKIHFFSTVSANYNYNKELYKLSKNKMVLYCPVPYLPCLVFPQTLWYGFGKFVQVFRIFLFCFRAEK